MELASYLLARESNKNALKKVLITGASRGIGLELAHGLAQEGYIVYATARDPKNATQLQNLAKQFPNNIIIKQLDVTDTEANIKKFAQEIGKVDVLINNAGSGLLGSAYGTTHEQREKLVKTNYLGAINVTNAVLDGMINSPDKSGTVLFISSIVGPLIDLKQSMYSATKAALEHYFGDIKAYTKAAGFPIKVAGIHPGPVLTQFPESAEIGNRFSPAEHPFKNTAGEIKEWKQMMAKNGQPISQTVATVLRVMHTDNPDFWNPTHPDVHDAFAAVYKDPTGNTFAAGPGLKPQDNQIKAKL